MLKRVLILSASAGAGHVRAAQALERAMAQRNAAEEIHHVDMLEYTNALFRTVYSKAYLKMVDRMPEVLGWLYDQHDVPWREERPKVAFDKLNAGPIVKLLERYQPQVAVCTHSLPAEIISWLKERGRLETRLVVVITDFDLHALWLCPRCDHYFVALEETRAHLEELGVGADRITVSGIPIDPVFAQTKNKQQLRAKHGLRPDRTTILISAGGYGVGKVEIILTSLLRLKHPAQLIAVCGRNQELQERLQAMLGEIPPGARVSLKVVGYTTEMDELMGASDLVVGKPGGLTTSEALAKGLVFVVVNPIPGQEERNSDHLLEAGAAIRCNNLPVLAYKIDKLLDEPRRFAALQANARRLGRPRSALEIVGRLTEWAN
jgi:processive 1,2-diacylglycerol beta-glucosyltransferase